MRVPLKIFTILILLATNTILKGQPIEKIGLHTDRNIYIAGEVLWFSIYNINEETGRLTPVSLIAYVELLNPWNVPVVQLRIKLTEGRGNGSFQIPDTLSTGDFTLRAYTNRMRDNLSDGCAMKNIGIFNAVRAKTYIRRNRTSGLLRINSQKNICNLHRDVIILADTAYDPRKKVAVKILAEKTGLPASRYIDLSVSVVPASVADTSFEFTGNQGSYASSSSGNSESEGHFLSLKIRNQDGSSTGRKNRLFMSVQGKVAAFRYAEMDSTGLYTFILPVDSRQRTFILQPEIPDNKMRLEIESSFSLVMPESGHYKDTLRGKEPVVFESLSFNHQVNRIYGITTRSVSEEAEPENILKRRFYGIPEMEVILNDYIKLPDMTEVFFELVPGIILREGRNGYEMKITNPLTGTFYEEPPLVMIDGVILNDLNVLVNLDPELVEKIEVVKTPYLTGDLILHGIVNVITISGDFSKVTIPDYAAIFPYRVVEPGFDFVAPSYEDEQIRTGRKPDLRNTLYWNPSLQTDANGKAEFEFWTPDVPGEYSITVHGISLSGEKITAAKSFIVK